MSLLKLTSKPTLKIFLWVQGIKFFPLRRPLCGLVRLSQRKTSELLLQTAYSQPHLVFGPLKRLQLHGVKDVEQRGAQQDGEAQSSQQIEGDTREGLLRSQSEAGNCSDGQLQEQQSQAHHSGPCCCVAHPLSTVQAHFHLCASLGHYVNQLRQLPWKSEREKKQTNKWYKVPNCSIQKVKLESKMMQRL